MGKTVVALLAASLSTSGSQQPQSVPSPSIAFRHDAEHVMIVLENLSWNRDDELDGMYDIDAAHVPWSSDRLAGSPAGWFEADLELWTERFGAPPLGTVRALHLAPGRSVACTMSGVAVADLSGCQKGLVGLCAVAPEGVESFREERADYFVLTEPHSSTETGMAEASSAAAGELERRTIAAAVERRFPDELARVRASKDALSERRRGERWRQEWLELDERLARGEGVLELDATEVRLTSALGSRFFVRAQWTVGDEVAFIASAWVRLEDEVAVIEQINSRASDWLRMWEFQNYGLDKSVVGEVLNVVDINHDGTPEVVFRSSGYEAIRIQALEYTAEGPGKTIVSYAAGC